MSVSSALDALIDGLPDGCVPTAITLASPSVAELVDGVETRVTLTGDTVDLSRAYARDYPERLVWYETVTVPGWELGREVLIHMRDLKRERGISRYRGVPLVVDDERPGFLSVAWAPWTEVLAR